MYISLRALTHRLSLFNCQIKKTGWYAVLLINYGPNVLDDIREGQGMAEGFIFEDWLASIDLCEETLDKLHRAKVRNADSVLLLSRYDITALKIDIGDRGTFRKAVRLLREQFPADDDIANASISSQIDDSFDGGDPDHIHVQQGSQLDALNKLRVEQEKLSARQSELPVVPP
jgi:hypothetical protein